VIVPDASVIVELLLNTPRAPLVTERLLGGGDSLHVPHLLDLEVAQALRRFCFLRDLTPQRGLQALDDLAALPLLRYAHDPFLPRIWTLRRNITAYDAAYLALAEALGARLITCDARLASAVGHKAAIELL
jgi:predicted nucleic acid-binding protein